MSGYGVHLAVAHLAEARVDLVVGVLVYAQVFDYFVAVLDFILANNKTKQRKITMLSFFAAQQMNTQLN